MEPEKVRSLKRRQGKLCVATAREVLMPHAKRSGRWHETHRRQTAQLIEALEARTLLSVATINAGTTIRSVPANMLGVNTAPWDLSLTSFRSEQQSVAAGINAVRLGGGSYIDGISSDPNGWHFNVYDPDSTPIGTQASYVAHLNATGIVDLDYGAGSPQEAAAMLAYLNGSTTNTTSLGTGEQWDSTTNTWTQGTNWQTAGYWASLRAAAPLHVDDGLNFLRVNHPAPYGFHYWELGNEVYGGWEMDEHGTGGDTLPMPAGSNPKAHDPTTLISFGAQFETLAAQIDPTITVGVDSQSVATAGTGSDSDWLGKILSQSVSQHFTLGYIADHYYTTASSGSETDAATLSVSTTPGGTGSTSNSYDWAQRATAYDNAIYAAKVAGGANGLLYLGNTQIIADEVNSIAANPGKQSTSLVNGLFMADAIGSALTTTGSNGLGGFMGFWSWDLHNGSLTGNNNSSSLYGWRQYGDYGIIAVGNQPYPDYFATQLASKIIQTGGTVVSASEDNQTSLDTFAVLEPNGHLDLLVINKTSTGLNTNTTGTPAILNETFNISGFTPSNQATVWQYGSAQDNLQEANPGSTTIGALSNSTQTLTLSNNSFSFGFPSYSMTVLDIAPNAPTVATPAAATPNPVVGTTTNLTVLGQEGGTDSGLTYTWGASGPASVLYSDNGTNTAKSTIATFSSAGSYVFTVTIADASNQTTTSTVNVTVNATLTSIIVNPGAPGVADGQTQMFSASAFDQFDNPMTAAFTWSVDDGSVGSVDGTGLYSAPTGGPGSATVRASSGTVSGTASVAITFTTIVGTVGDDNIDLSSDGSTLDVYFGSPASLAYSAELDTLGPLTVEALDGDDTVTVDFSGGGSPVPAAGLTVDGGAGSNSLVIIGTSAADSASIDGSSILFNGSQINYLNDESIAINSGADVLTQTAQPSAALTFSPTDPDATLNIDAGTFTIPASSGGILPVPFATLSINPGASVSLAGVKDPANHNVLVLGNLSNAGELDLGANDLILQGGGTSGLNQITTQLTSGFNAGHGYWNGSAGIVSTLAANDSMLLTTLGVMENTTGNAFDNQPSNVGDVIVKYTYYGDADLNGSLNGADYQQIDNGFGSGSSGWSNGDFNYDGVIDGSDYSLIDNAFNQLAATGASPLAAIAAVPAVSSKRDATPAGSVVAVQEAQTAGDTASGAAELKERKRNIWAELEENNF
jgi:hypothetical protein